jgi:hypothetical protein
MPYPNNISGEGKEATSITGSPQRHGGHREKLCDTGSSGIALKNCELTAEGC